MAASFVEAFQQLLGVFDQLEIRYAVGGSLASSLYGNYRMTNDVNVLVEIPEESLADLVKALGGDFYADEAMLRRSFRLGRPANVIHLKGGFKFDLFPITGGQFERSEMGRRAFRTMNFGPEHSLELAFTSPEDIILAKLRWYKQSGANEQQWRDVAGVVAIQGERLDRSYLTDWAAKLGIADLLDRVLRGEGPGPA